MERFAQEFGAVDTKSLRPSLGVGNLIIIDSETMVVAENQSPRYIADRLGRQNTRTFLDVYRQLHESIDKAAKEGLIRLRSQAQANARQMTQGSNVA